MPQSNPPTPINNDKLLPETDTSSVPSTDETEAFLNESINEISKITSVLLASSTDDYENKQSKLQECGSTSAIGQVNHVNIKVNNENPVDNHNDNNEQPTQSCKLTKNKPFISISYLILATAMPFVNKALLVTFESYPIITMSYLLQVILLMGIHYFSGLW